jgi:hypothetical protein
MVMARNSWRIFLIVIFAAVFCSLPIDFAFAQTKTENGSNEKRGDSSDVARELAASVRELKAQLEALNAQVTQMREDQAKSRSEINDLRSQLQRATSQPAASQTVASHPASSGNVVSSPDAQAGSYPSTSASAPATSATASVGVSQTAPENASVEERLNRLDENVQFIDAKVNDQYQTKAESGSKYRIRLSGIALLNLFSNRGPVDNVDFPTLAAGPQFLGSNSSIGGSLRQSQIGLEGFGPDLLGAHTSASIRFDFAGGAPQNPNGAVMGLVRLRTGAFRMDWTNTSLIAGQDFLFFAPIAPTSFATLAEPALSYAGNLWGWTPQVRVEHRIAFSEESHLLVQGGVLDPLSGDVPYQGYGRAPSWGEQSGQPAIAGRMAWNQRAFGETFTIGSGAYYAKQNWGFGRNVDSWASTIDLTLPLTNLFELSGEFYRGSAVGGLGGGIGQSVLLSGSLANPATTVHGLDSAGGWAQFKYKARTNFQVNAALGVDNPFAGELRMFSQVPSPYDQPLGRNLSWLMNFIYKPRSNVVMAAEFRRIKTIELSPTDTYVANHVNLSVGYIF